MNNEIGFSFFCRNILKYSFSLFRLCPDYGSGFIINKISCYLNDCFIPFSEARKAYFI